MSIEKIIQREAAKRTNCPELRKDLAQEAWLGILEWEKLTGSYCQSNPSRAVKTVIIPAISNYFWSNQSVVGRSRPKKHLRPSSPDLPLEKSKDEKIIVTEKSIERLQRRIFCEYKLSRTAEKTLSKRKFLIIKSRFLTKKKMPRNRLGVDLGISTERVRQIESRALMDLREAVSSVI